MSPFASIPTEEIDKLSNTNARGSFLCTREQVKLMLKQPRKNITGLTGTSPESERGCIVNVSSEAALGAMFYSGSYVHTTWSRLGMTKSAGMFSIKKSHDQDCDVLMNPNNQALDHGADGIRVNSLLAGYTVTDGFMAHPDGTPEFGEIIASKNPMKRIATPEEAADAIIFLCSPVARFVNGHGLSVDGGHSVTFA
jgi:NAD(P)-dependent dehydrogenase (short-subunit alcohol dehydrogenase family)